MVDIEAARARLTEMLDELDRSEETLLRESTGGDPGELSSLDQHPADSASNLSDNDREQAVREIVHGRRKEITAALSRIDTGNYGKCVDCGADLPEERLEARPEATRCVRCQSKAETTR